VPVAVGVHASGEELRKVKGLDEVVVCASVETGHPIGGSIPAVSIRIGVRIPAR